MTPNNNWLGKAAPGALAFAFLAAAVFIPFAGTIMLPLLPAPLAYSRLRYGNGNYAAASAACVVLVSLVGGFPAFSAIVLMYCLVGYALAGAMMAGEPEDAAVLKGALLPLIVMAPLAGMYFLAAGIDPWALLGRTLDLGLKESVDMYRQWGLTKTEIDALLPSLKLVISIIKDYLPAMTVASLAAVSLVNYILVMRHAVSAGVAARPERPLNAWCAPDHAVWGVIVPGFLMIAPVPVLRQMAGNVLTVFMVAYLFQGMAVVSFLFDRLKLPKALRVIGYLIITVQPFLLMGMCAAGLFDTWADFRRLRPNAKKDVRGPGGSL